IFTRADVALQVGDIVQQVEVQAVAPILESDKSTLSSVVESRTITNLPLNARQYIEQRCREPYDHQLAPQCAAIPGSGIDCAWRSSFHDRRSGRRLQRQRGPLAVECIPVGWH